jgi:hypothetical protein
MSLLGSAAYGTEIFLQPVSASGPHTLNGNEIILDGGGQYVTVDIRIDTWLSSAESGLGVCNDNETICSDPGNPTSADCGGGPCNANDGLLNGWSARIDSSEYVGILVAPPLPPSCTDDLDCQLYGNPGALCTDNVCDFYAYAYIDNTRPDWVFTGSVTIPLVDTSVDDWGFGDGIFFGSPVAYADVDKYCATFVLDVPDEGAAGSYTIGIIDDPNQTFTRDSSGYEIVPLTTTEGIITVLCENNADCDDHNECTSNSCNPFTGICSYQDNTPPGMCCNPENGNLLPIDDLNDCTLDVCNADGSVDHTPLEPGTACGGSPSGECDVQDTCDAEGNCIENFEPPTTECRAAIGDCDIAEFCTGSDADCPIDEFEPPGEPCGSGYDDECDNPDSCNGAGVCLENYEPPGTPCGDDTDEECNDPDTCNGAGACLSNLWPNGVSCDDGFFCTVDEFCTEGECGGGEDRDCSDGIPCTTDTCNEDTDQCDNDLDPGFCLINGTCYTDGQLNPANDCYECNVALSTTMWSARPIDSLCGEPNDTECTDPDTCDGAGTCLPNDEPPGTPCGDDTDTDCDNPDTCDGEGTCADNLEPNGTTCDDGLYCNVDEFCTDGECGGGTDRDCSDGIGCTDDWCNEVSDVCVNDPNNANCDNGQWCDGNEICDPEQDCIVEPGSVPDCNDGVSCTDDSCDEVNDECDNDPNDAHCDDGDWCNGFETCDPVLDCQPGTEQDCDDGLDCTDDSCDEVNDECVHDPNDGLCPDDGLWCNGPEICDPEDPDPGLPVSGCGHGPEPCGGPCDEENDVCLCEAPVSVAAGSRYLALTPQPPDSEAPMALMVIGDCPGGLTKYVGAPVPFDLDNSGTPDAGLGFLGDDPVFLKPVEWGGTVYVTGESLAPDESYIIYADCGTPGSPGLSLPAAAETWERGNTDHELNPVVNLDDLLNIIAGFKGDYSYRTIDKLDLLGSGGATECEPNQLINLVDVMEAIDTYTAQPYGCPDLCP